MQWPFVAFRGLVISVVGLAYHGLGFDPGCSHAEAVALLRHLRERGPLSRRDLQLRFQSFTATQRDRVLERMAAERLIDLDARKVAAVPLADFIRSLHAQPELREPQYVCPTAMMMADFDEVSGTPPLVPMAQKCALKGAGGVIGGKSRGYGLSSASGGGESLET
jgi:hypothetical protein